ncbi:hypothetical protein Tco_1558374 [Tanacetum coccineum]
MLIPNAFLINAIRDTKAYKDYEAKYAGVEVLMIQPEPVESTQGMHMTHRATRTPNPTNKPNSTTPLPPSDDQERDDIIEATQLSLTFDKIAKVYEEQQNVVAVEKQMFEEDVENLVEGEEEFDGTEFAEMVLLSDEDFGDRLEPRSHKENTKKNDNDNDDDEKKDDKKDDDDDNDDHDCNTLILTNIAAEANLGYYFIV